jgi:sterol 3beta-glucosyltransferase
MHITILALGSRGDIQPYATLGRGLQAAGHQVLFVTAESFEATITAHGLGFHPLPGDAQALVRSAGASMVALMRSFAGLAKGIIHDLDRLAPALRETDLILNQLPGGLFGYDLAEKFDVPMMLAAVMPLVRTGAFPMMGWPSRLAPVPGYNRFSYRMAEQLAWQMLRPTINRWRHETLGLPRSPFSGYLRGLHERGVTVLNGFSSHVVPRPPDWGDHVHITGYWFPDDAAWRPPDDLCRFLEAGPAPLFIGFGSMPLPHPERTTDVILQALEQSGQRAILHAGWGELGNRPLPDSVHKIQYAAYGWLFPRMSAVVHHGGSGTTAFGLRAGVPSVILPLLFDQFYWGRRVAALGVGPAPLAYRRLSTEKLAKAITLATRDPGMRQRAAALGQKIRAQDGVARAIEIIEE